MKKKVVLLLGMLLTASMIFAQENEAADLQDQSEDTAAVVETPAVESETASNVNSEIESEKSEDFVKHSWGFGFSVLGLHFDYAYNFNHFQLDANLGYAYFNSLDIGSQVDGYSNQESVGIISGMVFAGYNANPNVEGNQYAIGGSFITANGIVPDRGYLGAHGIFVTGKYQRQFNDVFTFTYTANIPIYCCLFDNEGTFQSASVFNLSTLPYTSLLSVYLSTIDFKFYINN